jgi:hypothetical protein
LKFRRRTFSSRSGSPWLAAAFRNGIALTRLAKRHVPMIPNRKGSGHQWLPAPRDWSLIDASVLASIFVSY